MRWIYYSIAIIATAISILLWAFIFHQVQQPARQPAANERSEPPTAAVADVLPVVEKLYAAQPYGPGDAIYEAQLSAFRAGRLVCEGGFFARRVVRDGVETHAVIATDRGPIPCK